ncbi:OprO/OprP family phosphate-selective porin [Pendulispora brunnea]|uniref:OprO/OprP family phosphate-selective porin n=1 Tax=Pendulispora brunnea TaxID=2905690 RepID=A0ABZ2KIV6_9BACT
MKFPGKYPQLLRATAVGAFAWFTLQPATLHAQVAPPPEKPAPEKKEHWYDKLKIRGYTQVRYNRLFESNDRLVNIQGDRSIGEGGGFFLRRARVVLYGDVHEQVSVYLQPDFASAINDQLNVTILRDWYADVFLDKQKELRVRVGQSKVPFGFENMQSSQNRVPFDRSDPINSAPKDERDIGIFVYYAPKAIRERFKYLVDSGLKGSGDYGVVALGVYNGQTANKRELNDEPHVIARAAYPFQIGKQIIELNLGGYTGKYYVGKDKDVGGPNEIRDVRAYGAFILYPQPIGLQVEYNIGRGPEYDSANKRVKQDWLSGGYALATLKLGNVIPYVRVSMYDGGRKFETNSPLYKVREVEAGIEWQVVKALELTVAYNEAERTFPEKPYPQESGRFLRLQCQFNY